MREFTPARFKAISGEAKRVAKVYGFTDEYSEDFAQFASMRIASGSKATVAQLWVDFLRGEFGRKRDQENNEAKISEKLGYIAMTDVREDFARYEPQLTSRGRECQNTLTGTHRAIFTFLCHGYTLDELGSAFGVSESRIGQYVMEIKKVLRESI